MIPLEQSSPSKPQYPSLSGGNSIKTPKLKKPAFEVYNMKHSFIDLDLAFQYVGDNSSYQKRVMKLLSIQWIFYSIITMGMPILFMKPKILCNEIRDGVQISYYCNENEACGKDFVILSDYNSLTSYFNLVCQDKFYIGLCAALYFIGTCVSGFIIPFISDIYGRKKTMLVSLISAAACLIICVFSPDIRIFMIFFAFTGFFFSGFEVTNLVYVSEISGARFRNFSGSIITAVWGIGQIFFSLISFIVVDWRYLFISIAIPVILITILSIFWLDESPRYLVAKRQYDEARLVLNKIAHFNLRPPFEFKFYEEMDLMNQEVVSFGTMAQGKKRRKNIESLKNTLKANFSYWNIFKNRKIRNYTFILLYFWFLRYFIYYSLQFSLSDIGILVNYNLLVFAFLEIIGAMLGVPIKFYLFRKTSLFLFLLIMSVGCGMFYYVRIPDQCYFSSDVCNEEILSLLIASVIKLAMGVFQVLLLTYTPETYPTQVRSVGFGFCMSFGKIGSILAPVFYTQYEYENYSPIAGLFFLGMFAMILLKFLPETYGKPMNEELDNPNEPKQTRNELEMQLISK